MFLAKLFSPLLFHGNKKRNLEDYPGKNLFHLCLCHKQERKQHRSDLEKASLQFFSLASQGFRIQQFAETP